MHIDIIHDIQQVKIFIIMRQSRNMMTIVTCVIYPYVVQQYQLFVSRFVIFCRLIIVFFIIAPYDRDIRNRRFTVDTFLAMHGPLGPPGMPGPAGNRGPRGAVGPQGKYPH
jgi:hypothetical protein